MGIDQMILLIPLAVDGIVKKHLEIIGVFECYKNL